MYSNVEPASVRWSGERLLHFPSKFNNDKTGQEKRAVSTTQGLLFSSTSLLFFCLFLPLFSLSFSLICLSSHHFIADFTHIFILIYCVSHATPFDSSCFPLPTIHTHFIFFNLSSSIPSPPSIPLLTYLKL
jgi:hypothetical protein